MQGYPERGYTPTLMFPPSSIIARVVLAAAVGGACFALARPRHRSELGWSLLGGVASLAFGILGIAVPAWLATRGKVDLRHRYLELKAQERFLRMVGGPDLGSTISTEERILMILANNPEGLHLNAIAQGVGESWRGISESMNQLIRQGRVHARDDLYFLDGIDS